MILKNIIYWWYVVIRLAIISCHGSAIMFRTLLCSSRSVPRFFVGFSGHSDVIREHGGPPQIQSRGMFVVHCVMIRALVLIYECCVPLNHMLFLFLLSPTFFSGATRHATVHNSNRGHVELHCGIGELMMECMLP